MTGRGLHGRRVAGRMFLAVLALDALFALLVATPPTSMGGGMFPDPSPYPGMLILGVGATLHVAGLVWMIRIYRADPEAHRSFWRSRRS